MLGRDRSVSATVINAWSLGRMAVHPGRSLSAPLVVGKKKSGKLWRLGTEEIKEVNEFKYLGVWINRQATGHNHINHLEEKAMGLHNLARGAKFWRGDEDIHASRANNVGGSV